MTQERPNPKAIVECLFDADAPKFRTQASGSTHARFAQRTDLSDRVTAQVLDVLDAIGITYYLFAGSLVGFVRDGKPPHWLDDVDVMLFGEEREAFASMAVPTLRELGFKVARPHYYPAGGYHILANQLSNNRRHRIPMSEGVSVEVPWAQVDVFFSEVDSHGMVRNCDGWGLYHHRQVEAEWITPAKHIKIHGRERRVFGQYERYVLEEYGDVHNNLVIDSHGTSGSVWSWPGVSWLEVKDLFEHEHMAVPDRVPPSLAQTDLSSIQLEGYRSVSDDALHNLDELCYAIAESRAGRLLLRNPEHFIWVFDLKEFFPSLLISAEVSTPEDAGRALVLQDGFEAILSDRPDLTSFLEAGLEAARNLRPT